MTEDSRTNQSTSSRASAEAQQSQVGARQYGGGDAFLDAEAAVEDQMGSDPVIDQAAATNIAGNVDSKQPTNEKPFNTMSDYPAEGTSVETETMPPSIDKSRDMAD